MTPPVRPRAPKGPAQLKVMLTAHERAQLKGLGYWPDEVDDMRLEVAARVLQKGTTRPFGERTMPSAWRRSAARRGTAGGLARAFLVCVFALALAVGWMIDMLPFQPLIKRLETASPWRPRAGGGGAERSERFSPCFRRSTH
eukprot:TRINITY_DN43753_c0_g1_i1.p1 TRINITY_DN43753_c0_g1~~TRINITY_DN43753_c0_g1_i1.p1  ORF type:complete len:142 (+),score=14.97 TRINITY_DN43753_c0_g1_i1:26-451(+)